MQQQGQREPQQVQERRQQTSRSLGQRQRAPHLPTPGSLLLLGLLRVAVEEEIGHHLPWHIAGDPRSLRTSLARNHHIRPILWGLLLLRGTVMSRNLVGESTLVNATMGMLA